jgi:CubicO group peptidase (beta-lactamase class C family)
MINLLSRPGSPASVLLAACLIALPVATGRAETGSEPLNRAEARSGPSGLSARIREGMEPFVDKKEISGAVMLVGSSDRIISLEAIGLRDVEGGLPMRTDTLFRIASMTKPITAIGLMMLADEGKLSVDDPVEKHLPEFRGQMMVTSRPGDAVTLARPPRPITLRDLLTHTSGLPAAPPQRTAGRGLSLAEVVATYAKRPLDFEPGSRWSYCSPGTDTLGRVIEVASGRPFDSFLKERLFDPLGMADTTFYPAPEQMKRAAVVYNRKDGELRPVASLMTAPTREEKYPSPAGGLFSTAPDLSRLYQMMLHRGTAAGRRYLSVWSVDEMTRVHTGDLKAGFSDGIGFGLGWGVVRRPTGVTEMLTPGAYGHGGGLGTQCWIDPHKSLFTILLTQRPDLNARDEAALRRELPRIAFFTSDE